MKQKTMKIKWERVRQAIGIHMLDIQDKTNLPVTNQTINDIHISHTSHTSQHYRLKKGKRKKYKTSIYLPFPISIYILHLSILSDDTSYTILHPIK